MPPKRFYSYLKQGKTYLIISFISVLIYLFSLLTQPFFVGQAIDYALKLNKNGFIISTIFILVLAIAGSFFDFIFEYNIGKLSQKIIYSLRKDIFKKYNTISVAEMESKEIGNLSRLEVANMESVANGIFAVFKSLVEGILTIIITIIMMFIVNFILAIAVIILSPLSMLVSRFVAKFSHNHFKKQAQIQATLNSYSNEAVDNILTLQSLNQKEEFINKFKKQNDLLNKEGVIAQFSASWTNPVTRLVNNFIYAIIGILGIIMIIFTPQYAILNMTLGKLSSFLSYTTQFTKPFNEVAEVISDYENALVSFKRMDAFLSWDDDIDNGIKEVNEIKEITFDDLSFSYDKNKKLIENFSFSIKKGQKIAIVGPTGAGKSTIINLIMRFFDPDNGYIKINNEDYTTFSKESLRNNFSMVLQDTWIFKGTIKENISYGNPNATEEEIIQAGKKSNADSFIQLLPLGYNTIISSNCSLSSGEKQMIAIARCMLSNKDIVILDEATSNVDTRSEQLITDAFDKLLKEKTSIVIAHRISTIVNADTILVIKDGAIIEHGAHKDLLLKNGYYKKLIESQYNCEEI